MEHEVLQTITELQAGGDGAFLELARKLRDAVDAEPRAVRRIAEETILKPRRIYCLVRIARTFDPLIDDDDRLIDIGWTKLDLIAPHVTTQTIESLLQLAENSSPAVLARALTGTPLPATTHTLQLTFTSADYTLLREAFERAGAKPKGKGHVGKEEALMRIVGEYLSHRPRQLAG
mgnify:CR=1 FL=1